MGRVLFIGRWMIGNRVRKLRGRPDRGFVAGDASKKPKGDLNLQPGERVRVIAASAMPATLDPKGRNNGLTFEPDMLALAGCPLKVSQPIRKMIHEETGKMITLTDTVALEGVLCSGNHARNCPRANPLFWREAWLQRDTAPKA